MRNRMLASWCLVPRSGTLGRDAVFRFETTGVRSRSGNDQGCVGVSSIWAESYAGRQDQQYFHKAVILIIKRDQSLGASDGIYGWDRALGDQSSDRERSRERERDLGGRRGWDLWLGRLGYFGCRLDGIGTGGPCFAAARGSGQVQLVSSNSQGTSSPTTKKTSADIQCEVLQWPAPLNILNLLGTGRTGGSIWFNM